MRSLEFRVSLEVNFDSEKTVSTCMFPLIKISRVKRAFDKRELTHWFLVNYIILLMSVICGVM